MSLQQFVSVTSDGKMWHAIRNATDGSWTPFGDVKAATGSDPGQFISAACADTDHGLQVCGVTSDGKMWHAIRDQNTGSWTPFGDVKAATGSDPGHFTSVACASSDEGLHVSGSSTDGKMWHAIRNATNGSWTPFRDVKAATGSDPGQIVAVGMGYL